MCKCFQCEQQIDNKEIRLMDSDNINVYYFCSENCQDDFIKEQNEYHSYRYPTPLIFKQ